MSKSISKVLSLCLVLLLAIGAVPTAIASDIGKNWAFYNDGTFCYDDNIGSWSGEIGTIMSKSGVDINVMPVYSSGIDFDRQVTVAIIDTGVNTDHPALKDSIWSNTGEIPDDGIDNDNNGYADDVNGWNFYDDTNVVYNRRSYDEDAHGTHIAGIISANMEKEIRGVAGGYPKIKIMPLKIIGGINGTGTVGSLIDAIKYAKDNGADICNISLGIRTFNEDLFDTMEKSRMLFVTSACNGDNITNGVGYNLENVKSYPACYELKNQIVVGSMECNGTLHYNSNYSTKYVDIVAPGTMVYSTSTEKSGYEIMTGTSMATAMVSGASALVLSSHKDYNTADLKSAIINSAKHYEELSSYIRNGNVLDTFSAVSYVPVPSPTTENTTEETTSTTVTEIFPTTTKPIVKKTTVTLPKTSANIYVKGSITLKVTVKNGVGRTTFKSSNTRIAKVDSKGKVTALKKGKANITVTNNGVKKTFKVTVKNPKLNKTSVTLAKGKTFTLKITGKIGTVKFTSSNKKIATVNSKGKITVNKKAKKGKTCTITVKTNGISLKCKVKVK